MKYFSFSTDGVKPVVLNEDGELAHIIVHSSGTKKSLKVIKNTDKILTDNRLFFGIPVTVEQMKTAQMLKDNGTF